MSNIFDKCDECKHMRDSHWKDWGECLHAYQIDGGCGCTKFKEVKE